MASPTDGYEALRFQPWQSAPDVAFWQKLATLKLDKFQLSDTAQRLVGYFAPGRSPTVPARLTVDDSAFSVAEDVEEDAEAVVDRARFEWKAHGVLYNTNTLEDFKALNKQALLQRTADDVLDLILNPIATTTTATSSCNALDALNAFVLITFADLKKHSFFYWFGFPALTLPQTPLLAKPAANVTSVLSVTQQSAALLQLMAMRRLDPQNPSAPLGMFPAFFVIETTTTTSSGSDAIAVYEFSTWIKKRAVLTEPHAGDTKCVFGFVDPCALASHPGWPLRNYLALLAALPDEQLSRDEGSIHVLSFREHVRHAAAATTTEDGVAVEEFEWKASRVFQVKTGPGFYLKDRSLVKAVGWETNARGKMGPRLMELSAMLDPVRLAEQSVDLNLKLMLWRQLPSLQLDVMAKTKCLVLGAGTLGCFTARSLLSWGFRHITMVDNSVVSHSNPVRQPLFEFADVGKPKAECAARALQRIYPLAKSSAVHLSIPMAGHALSNEHLIQDAKTSLEKLTELIDAHDVVFLGTDSRESRWLPTVICAASQKPLLNAALGFDSYLVMRHGVGTAAASTSSSSLGCYFCNDIVSPRDSLKDRTLDQMCTVTRPGLAPIAASTAVELFVALLHSPEGIHTTADEPSDASSPLGFVPHQLRGYLSSFSSMVITGQAFDKCIACSDRVLEAFRAAPFTLLENACNLTAYLEELTGLNTLAQAADAFLEELDIEGDEEDGDDF